MLAGLVKTSLVNFPGRVAAAVFLPGCNLRCPFCHNADLATASVVSGPRATGGDESGYVAIEDVYAHIEKRKGVLGGLAISGGEPLLSPALPDLIRAARALSLAVKIDTNGTLPDRLAAILSDPELRPDMIAIDVKTAPARYGELATEPAAGRALGASLERSLAILAEARPCREGHVPRPLKIEYRTVLVPGLVGEAEIREIAKLLPADADWELARFAPGACLNPEYNGIDPYGPAALANLVVIAQGLRRGARLR